MQISFAGFGIEFIPDEAVQFAQTLLSCVHKDRKYICLILYFSSSFLQDWYNAIRTAFMPAIVKRSFNDLTDEQKEKIYNFMMQIDYLSVANTLDNSLLNLRDRYDQRQLRGVVTDGKDMLRLDRLRSNIITFKFFVTTKGAWYRILTMQHDGTRTVSIDEINQ